MTIKVDLLPTEKKRFGIDPVVIFLVLIIILFTAGFFVYGKSLETTIQRKQDEERKIEQEIADVRSKLPGIQKMKEENAKIQAEIQTIQGLKNDPVRYANLLWEIAEILPNNIWVNSIAIEPGQQSVVFSGTALTYGSMKPLESIALLMRNLQEARYFKDATLSSTQESKTEFGIGYNFQIDTHYDQVAALKRPDQIAPKGAAAAPGASPSPGTAPSGAPAAGAAPAPGASPNPKGAPAPAASNAPQAPGGARGASPPPTPGKGGTSMRDGGRVGVL